jgi:Uma2 family endonuclease
MVRHKATTPLDDTGDAEEEAFHYYDQHPTAEDLMGESIAQSTLVHYLMAVLRWLYHAEGWLVVNDLNIYRERKRSAYPLAPDVAVFKGVVVPNPAARAFRSWRLYQAHRPPPQVVFEVCSDSTWQDDLYHKPAKYAALGVREYYAYDPNDPPYVSPTPGRLRGWRIQGGVALPQAPDGAGRVWSDELQSYLVPDGSLLRLYDRQGEQRLTEAEAERRAKEAERRAKEAAWAKLRELGIDPDRL